MNEQQSKQDLYFAASNAKSGFYSYFEDCFWRPEIEHLYLVKGGPGTGKSSFLHRVGEEAEKRGYLVEWILCSSDPKSLDGLILQKGDRRIGFCDATSPHAAEPKEPGLREEILNLGQFWDASLLIAHKEELRQLEAQKAEAYRSAYRYLSASGELFSERLARLSPYIRQGEIKKAAEKFAKEIGVGPGFSTRPSVLTAIGMDGVIKLDTFFALAKRRFLIEDCHDSAAYFLEEVGRIAIEKKQPIRLSYDPLLPGRIDGILFEDEGIALQIGKESSYPTERIRMRRFVDVAGLRAIKGKINYAAQMKRALMGGALESLAEVKAAHFAMEEIYQAAMDFPAKEAYTEEFLKHFFAKT